MRSRGWEKFREEFGWSSRDDLCILESLRFHASRREMVRLNFKPPTMSEIRRVIAHLEKAYHTVTPRRLEQLDTDVFLTALKSVDMSSSPGWPWKKDFKTNRDLFMKEDGSLNQHSLVMVFDAVRERLEDLKTKPIADDINVFVKDELHKKTKIDAGAFRLISSVSITDTIVDRILFGELFDKCYTYEGFSQTPNKAGWTPYKGGYKWLAKRYRRGKKLFADKSSWDWTMMAWVAYVLMELMARMAGFEDPVRLRQIRNRMIALFSEPVFNIGGWLRFSQALGGLMKSGCLGTIVWNGMAQVALHALAEIRRVGIVKEDPDVLGDDTVQSAMEALEEYILFLNQAGCLARDFHVSDLSQGGKLDFAGHEFDERECLPAYGKKHMGCLYEQSEFKAEQLDSYLRLYAFDPEVYKRLAAWATELGVRVYSRDFIIDWYNGDHDE